MERVTESYAKSRVDKATIDGYELTFIITDKTNNLETINVNGMNNSGYSFNMNYDVNSNTYSISFYGDYDNEIINKVCIEVGVIKSEYDILSNGSE